MDNAFMLLGQLFGVSSHKKLSLVISFVFVILFWVWFYFFLGEPFKLFSLKLLDKNLWHIFSLGLCSVVALFFSGLAIKFFAEKLLDYFYEKNWIVAFNHVWGGGEQIRCINDGNYVHVRGIDNGNNLPPVIFYTFCSTCKIEKRLIHDDGRPIPLSNAQNIIRGIREKWKIHNVVVDDKKGNFYCKQCYSRLNDSANTLQCPLGCSNTGIKEEIEKIRTLSLQRTNASISKKRCCNLFHKT